jgi:quercetin dioxygenase-like cupin family protein
MSAMALKHAQVLEVIDIGPLGAALAGTVSRSLLKTDRLQLMRVVLRAGENLPEHRVAGEITIQCIEGVATVRTPSRDCPLHAGELVVLSGGELHSVHAAQDTSLLVSLLLG